MKNRLIIPEDSPFSPAQRTRIRDIWTIPPIGIRSLSGKVEFPDLVVYPNHSVGRACGKDSRGVSFRPESGSKYELVRSDPDTDYQKANPRIKVNEINIERGEYLLEQERSDRYALTTRVAPTRCETTYKAIIDVDPSKIVRLKIGRFWASEEVLKKEEDGRKWALEHSLNFF